MPMYEIGKTHTHYLKVEVEAANEEEALKKADAIPLRDWDEIDCDDWMKVENVVDDEEQAEQEGESSAATHPYTRGCGAMNYLVTFSAINPTVEVEGETEEEAAKLAVEKIDEMTVADIKDVMRGVVVEKVEPLDE